MARFRSLDESDASELAALYRDYDWWADRRVSAVADALSETDIAVGLADEDELVAAARVLTDYAYYATVFDVVVAAERRGEGFGAELLAGLRAHPDLRSVPGLSLSCREGLVPFYESAGFERVGPEVAVPEGGTERLVRMTAKPVEWETGIRGDDAGRKD